MSCNDYDVFNSNPLDNLLFNTHRDVYSMPMQTRGPKYSLIVAMNLVNHVMIVTLTLAMAYKCWVLEFKKTAMHAHLCTMGFVLLMAEGMMVRYQGNLFYQYFITNKNLVHGLLQFVGGSLGIGGTLQKYWGKEIHFKSAHAKLGLVACILCAINFVCGLWSLFVPSTLSTMRLFHGILGLATFIIGMLAQFYGYETGFFHRNFTNKRTYKFITIVILALSTIGPLKIVIYKLMFNLSHYYNY